MKTNLKRISKRSLALILGILMLFSTLMVGSITTNATSRTFTNGTTIYFNTSGVSGWASDDATIGAIFYYKDNDNWCIETNSEAYSDDNIKNKTPFTNSSVYKTCTKVADNIYSVTVSSSSAGSVRFLRINKSTGTDIWNYSKRMSVDQMGSNNCVEISNWNDTGSWTTYDTGGSTNVDYYLTGYMGENINKGDYKFAATDTVGIYTCEITLTDALYVTITDGNNNKYGPTNYEDLSGKSGQYSDKVGSTSGNEKWGITGQSGNKIVITWDANNKKIKWSPATTIVKHTVSTSGSNFTTSGAGEYKPGENVTVTLTPASKYMITKVSVTPSTLDCTYNDNGSAKTVTFKMPDEDVTIAVTTAKDYSQSTLALVGRFKVRTAEGADTFKHLGGRENAWVTDLKNTDITFTYDTTEKVFKLNTYMTVKELTKSSDDKYYFRFSLDGVGYGVTGSDYALTDDIKSGSFTKTEEKSFYFNGKNNTGLVVLIFNPNTNTLSYELKNPTTYTVTTGVKVSTNGTDYSVYNGADIRKPTGGGDISATDGTILTASTPSGYTFVGWESKIGDTITSIEKTDNPLTYTPTADTTVYAKYKKNYTVSIGTHTNGKIKIDGKESNKTVAAGTSVTIKAEPSSGYVFKEWTGDLSSEASDTVTKVVVSNITANATFEKERFYLIGKLTIIDKNGNTVSTAANNDYSLTSTNIPFELYDAENQLYRVVTQNTVAELSGAGKYFRIRKGSSTAANDTQYQPSCNNNYSLKYNATGDTLVAGADYNFIFSDTNDNSGPVILWFDAKTLNFYYTIAPYNISYVGDAHGDFTDKVTSATKGTIVEVKPNPKNGYMLDTLKYNDGTDHTITADSEGKYKFTMPDKDVTVTATFKEDLSTNCIIHIEKTTDKWKDYDFVKKAGQSTGTVSYATVELAKDTEYKFGIIANGTWYTKNYTINYPGCTDLQFENLKDVNCKLKTTVAGDYVFKFDSDSKKLSVTYPTYTATIKAGENGSVDKETITGPQTVTATPDEGYLFDKWEYDSKLVSVDNVNSATTTITPLADGGEVTAKFVKAYKVTVNGVTGYTSEPENLTAIKADTEIKITLPTQEGYNFSINVTGVTNYTFANDVITFTMPANNVTIDVSVTYDINVENPTNGKASVNTNPAAAGEIITVTATPDDGYELDKITVTYGENTAVTVTDNKFEMPASPVTVTVTFKEKLYTVTIGNNVNGNTKTVQAGKINPVGIFAQPITGYDFKKWDVTLGNVNVTDLNSPSTTITATSNATLTAEYFAICTVNYDFTNKHVASFTASYTYNDSTVTLNTTDLTGNFKVDKDTSVSFTVVMEGNYLPIPNNSSWTGGTEGTFTNDWKTYTFTATSNTSVVFKSYLPVSITPASQNIKIGASAKIEIVEKDNTTSYELWYKKTTETEYSKLDSAKLTDNVFTTGSLPYGKYNFVVKQTVHGYVDTSNEVEVNAVIGNVVLKYLYREYDTNNGVAYDPYIGKGNNLKKNATEYSVTLEQQDISTFLSENKDNLVYIYNQNVPTINSNYFNYEVNTEGIRCSFSEDYKECTIVGNEMTPTERRYKVSINGKQENEFTSYYQQKTFLLDAKDYCDTKGTYGYVWYNVANGNEVVVSTDQYYKLRVARNTNLIVKPLNNQITTPTTFINEPVYNKFPVETADGYAIKLQMNMLVENYLPKGAVRTRTGVAYCAYTGTQPTIDSADLSDLIHNSQKLAESGGSICEIGKLEDNNKNTVTIMGYHTKQDNENGKFIFSPTAKLDSQNTYLVYSYLTYTMNNRSVTIVSANPVTASAQLYKNENKSSTNS